MRASDVYYRLQGAERAWYTGAGTMITQLGEGVGSRGIVRRSSRWRKHQADATTRPSLPFHRELGGVTETTRGGKGSCRRGEPCGAGRRVTPFSGNDIASGACSSDSRHRLSRASCKAAAVAVALVDHVRLEGQRTSDTVEFLPRREDEVQYNSQSLPTLGKHSRRTSHTHCTGVGPVSHVSRGA